MMYHMMDFPMLTLTILLRTLLVARSTKMQNFIIAIGTVHARNSACSEKF